MIAVIMGDHQVIEMVDSRGFGRSQHAIGIAPVEPRPAGIHQLGFMVESTISVDCPPSTSIE